MSTWTAAADALLTLAGGVEVPVVLPTATDPSPEELPLEELVSRVFVAPGPDYAKDCSLLAVHAGAIRGLPLASDTDLGPEFGCILVPAITLVLAFRWDCVPVPAGTPPKLPTPEEVEAWSTLFLHRATLLWQAVADGVLGGTLDVGGCHDASLGDGRFVGPTGRVAGLDLPVTVRLQS